MDKFTDQYFTYRETPVDYDGVGNITRIKGNTLVWNQLMEHGNFDTTAGFATSNLTNVSVSDGVFSGVCNNPGNFNVYISRAIPTDTNHKIFIAIDVKCIVANSIRLRWPYVSSAVSLPANTWYRFALIVSPNSNYNTTVGVQMSGILDATYQFKNYMCIDLTQMFGAGNEPTSVEEFQSLFPLPFYEYNQGTLLDFKGTGIRTVGKNQSLVNTNTVTKPSWYSGTWTVPETYGENGIKQSKSNGTGGAGGFRVSTLPLGTYTLSVDIDNQESIGTTVRLVVLGKSGGVGETIYNSTSPKANKVKFTITIDKHYDEFAFRLMANTFASGYTYTLFNKIQLQFGSTATDYEPYTETTTDLPTLTYFPNGMKSAGSAYDELTSSKAITRIGTVDLGTLTWYKQAGASSDIVRYATAEVRSTIKRGVNSQASNALCALFATASANNGYSGASTNCITVDANGDVSIYPTQTYTDANAFKTAMNGVYLHYELSAESEQDINIKMLYPIYADGTEQILPTSDTSPFFGDIEYYNGTEGETNIRKFWLINGENERWDLTEKDFKAFLNNPQGLGFRKTVESVRYGERQNKVSETYNFPQPQGELLFYDSYNSTRYDKYNKFIRFLMNQPITLYYMIPVSYISGIANIYTLDCEVTEVQKTESKTDNILRSSIVFNGMEFYKGDPITVNGTGTSYTLTNEGDFPVGFEITIEGNLTNPYVTLSQDGELYGEAKFDSETAFNSVYVNSNDGEQNVILEQGGAVIPNPLSYQDLSISNGSIYVTFVKLARGDSELSIGAESGTVSSVKIEFTPMYRSV